MKSFELFCRDANCVIQVTLNCASDHGRKSLPDP